MKNIQLLRANKNPLHTKKNAMVKKTLPQFPLYTLADFAAGPLENSYPQGDKTESFFETEYEEEMTLEALDRYPPPDENDLDKTDTFISIINSIFVVNLEDGHPSVSNALNRMEQAFLLARQSNCRVMKMIHGYGSTGRGGAIRNRIQHEMANKKRSKEIVDFIPGEDFDPFTVTSKNLLDRYLFLPKIPEYGKCNHGITVVLI